LGLAVLIFMLLGWAGLGQVLGQTEAVRVKPLVLFAFLSECVILV